MYTYFNNAFFDNFFDDFAPSHRGPKSCAPHTNPMKTDIKTTDDAFILDVNLPGFSKEDISAELKKGYLTIRAEAKREDNEEKYNYVCRERFTGTLVRSFFVGHKVKPEDVTARFENGVLTVNVPKIKEDPKLAEANAIAIA